MGKPATGSATAAVGERSGADALTVAAARRALAAQLRAHDVDSPELDARILVGHALGLDHAALTSASARVLGPEEAAAIAALARRRLAHEPVARILGSKEFWSLPLRIDAATLLPRPETETVVDAALASRTQPLRIADLGTGSGALLLALLSELPSSSGIGTDLSFGALRVAQGNARQLGLTRAAFVACDMAAALRGPFDVIVSNPPYIASGDIAALAPEVRDFDPRQALDGGADGLDFYRAIAVAAPPLLAPDGALVVELGAGQAGPVTALLAAAGLALSSLRSDLMRVPRALVVTKGHERRALDPGKKALGISAGTD
jgi:release factor glutamine methyltransferase